MTITGNWLITSYSEQGTICYFGERICSYFPWHLSVIAIYLMGLLYFYPKTVYLDGDYTPSWESSLCLIWFIWFPLKFVYNKLRISEESSK